QHFFLRVGPLPASHTASSTDRPSVPRPPLVGVLPPVVLHLLPASRRQRSARRVATSTAFFLLAGVLPWTADRSECCHASKLWTTWPCTSVSRKSRPA